MLELSQAAEFLNVSRQKLSSLAKDGTLKYTQDPLDKRKKLFKLSDLERLRRHSSKNGN
jgi:predicted site-specific integrase-resolvase